MDRRFLASIKNALKCLASVNDERNKGFPLNLKNSLSSISRLSAYLHLFHHQVRSSPQLFLAGWTDIYSLVYHPYHQTIVVCLVGEEGGDVSTRARQLNGERAISAASLCCVSTRDLEDPRCPPSSEPSRYVKLHLSRKLSF